MKFEITRDAPAAATQPLSIRITATGKMINGERDSTRTINIAPEATSRFIYVSVKGDRWYEPHSTITAAILDDDDDMGFMVSPTQDSAQVTVLDDDFPWGVRLGMEANRTMLTEGQSATLTFTFKTHENKEPHTGTGTFDISVQGNAADYSLSANTISAPQSAFQLGPGGRYYEATSTVTFTALTDSETESAEHFTVSVSRGEGAQESIRLPGSLILTISDLMGPGVPQSVKAQESGANGIKVSWEKPSTNGGSDITGYVVQWKEAVGSWDTAEDVSEVNTQNTHHTITGLNQGTRYFVRVIAVNAVENSLPSGEVSATINNPATGQPSVSGKAQVGETLTASTSGISDVDGLAGAQYSYQWVRVSCGADSDIQDAVGTSYVLTGGDEGKTIRVRVSFTDDMGNEESLISAATDTVAPEPPPLRAVSIGVPPTHNGVDTFSFELRFSEAPRPDFSYRVLRDHAFIVAWGEVTKTPRLAKPENIRWKIVVQPHGGEDVTIVLPETTDCGDPGAICTEDGRMLSNRLILTVHGP